MKLLTKALLHKLPLLYSQEEKGMEAVDKFFTPDSGWTWWASVFDGEDLFFRVVNGRLLSAYRTPMIIVTGCS